MILKLATFNLRYQNDGDKALGRDFAARRASIAAQLRAAAPDAVGFQELLPGMRDWLESELGDYQFVGVEREAGFAANATPSPSARMPCVCTRRIPSGFRPRPMYRVAGLKSRAVARAYVR